MKYEKRNDPSSIVRPKVRSYSLNRRSAQAFSHRSYTGNYSNSLNSSVVKTSRQSEVFSKNHSTNGQFHVGQNRTIYKGKISTNPHRRVAIPQRNVFEGKAYSSISVNQQQRRKLLRKQVLKKESEANASSYNGSPVAKMGGVSDFHTDRKSSNNRLENNPMSKAFKIGKKSGTSQRRIILKKRVKKSSISGSTGQSRKSKVFKSGKKVGTSKKAKFGKKLDAKIKKKKGKGKSQAKALLLDKILDKVGRDSEGNLNIIGIILAIVLILPILGVSVVIVAIVSVVVVVVCAVVAVFLFIADLFTIKTEDMTITDAYTYVTHMDAERNKELYEEYEKLKKVDDKVYFIVNGSASDGEQFLYSSDGDKYLYYLNAKYEVYNIDKKIPKDSNIFGVTRIKQEMAKIHDYTFHYTVKQETKDVEKTITTVDKETGEEKTETVIEPQKIGTIEVTAKTIQQFVDENPKTLSEDAKDRYYPIQDLDRFENKIFLESPLGVGNVATAIEKYGYRGRDDYQMNYDVKIQTTKGQPIYATGDGKVGGTGSNNIWTYNIDKKRVLYWNLQDVQVSKGQQLKTGDLIGYSNGNFSIAIKEERPLRQVFEYPAIFFDDLALNYYSNNGYHPSAGGLTGDLLNPPANVLKWKEEVQKVAKKYEIEEYVNLILAIIWEESGGLDNINPDIMQASESQGKKPGEITDPLESIDAGTKYLATLLKSSKNLNLGDYAAVQAYNYGGDFLNWLKEKELSYSFDVAKNYAAEKSNGKVISYNNPVAGDLGYNWRYGYGNMFYVNLVSQHIMKDDSELVKIAQQEIGNSNGAKYWEWFGFPRRVEWCAIFVSWVADQAGYLQQGRVPKMANTKDMVNWYTEKGKYKTTDSGYVPQPGDLIFFDWTGNKTGKDHVGIVEYCDGKIIQTIEGNSGDTVKRNTYDINNKSISGYGLTGSN